MKNVSEDFLRVSAGSKGITRRASEAVVRHLAGLVARDTPAPDIPAYLSPMSLAKVMLAQWTVSINERRPKIGKVELENSSYVMPARKHEEWKVDYTVCLGDRSTKKRLHNKYDADSASWINHFEKQFGVGSVSQHQATFLPHLMDAYNNNGFPITITVPLSNIQMDTLSLTLSQLCQKLVEANGAPKVVSEIFEQIITVCLHQLQCSWKWETFAGEQEEHCTSSKYQHPLQFFNWCLGSKTRVAGYRCDCRHGSSWSVQGSRPRRS